MENKSSFDKFCTMYMDVVGLPMMNISMDDPNKAEFDSEFVRGYQVAKSVPYDEAIKIKENISVENVSEKTYSALGYHYGYRHGIDAVIADNAKGELKIDHLLDVSFRQASSIVESNNKTMQKTR